MSKVLDSFFSYLLSNAQIVKPENVSKEDMIQEMKSEIYEVIAEWREFKKNNEEKRVER